MKTIIALAQQKGGVGKTTATLCLGGALVERGCKVLLVDLDAQGGLTETLGKKPDSMHHTAVDLILGYTLSLDAIISTNLPGLDLIPSHQEMGMMERVLMSRRNHQVALKNSLNRYLAYDYILLDCPPALGRVTFNALVAANQVILPVVPEYLSVYALKNMLHLIKEVRTQYNPDLAYRILLSMVDNRNRVHVDLTQQVRSYFAPNVYSSVIPIDTRLREIILTGLPITCCGAKSRSIPGYRGLAEEVMCDNGQESQD